MKKIDILALHLNYGGVESSIINQANMLCDDYEVKIVSIYKLNNPAFHINNKVKIEYLTDLWPNKEEFISSVKSFNIINIIKEGIKSIRILYLKKFKMINYIKNSNADIIISSRIDITNLLGKSEKKCIKIAEEHRHHNNNQKYIRKVQEACKNIDYLICVSKELTSFYSNYLSCECIYIPNALDYWTDECSNLSNKRLISVGRLSHEKGFLDLIEVFRNVYSKDKDFSLDIIGDGNEKSLIETKIKEYSLEKSVKLHGFRDKDYINKLLFNSSIYLMCSYEESFGIVLIEAMSFGLPCIAFSSAQGACEIIKNNMSGFLIDGRNIDEMSNKIIELFENKKMMKEFSKESKLISKEFCFDNIKNEWLLFIKKLLECEK